MFLKTGIILFWVIASYFLLVFFSNSLIMSVVTAFALAQGLALVGLNIMHDGGHGSYSKNKTINWFMSFTLDLIGASHVLWRQKHNILHHTYTNIDEVDDDIHTYGLIRLSPHQEWRPWHRFQSLYAFPAYGFLTMSWLMFSNFREILSGRVANNKLPPTRRGEVVLFFLTKAFYLGYALVLPSFLHPISHVLITFVGVHFVLSLTLLTVFQLAHTVEGNTFPEPEVGTGVIDNEWAIHQVETTANFAGTNKLATWCIGGLNFQIEHHLFPKVCHVHYPAISAIVEETCREFSVDYTSYPTVRSAIAGHYRFLKALGNPSS